MTGIYAITCVPTQKVYIGSSVDITRRWREHRRELRRGMHSNRHLQRAWAKHGELSFVFSIIESCDAKILVEREQHHVNERRPRLNGTAIVRPNFLSQSHTPEAKAKMRAAKIGKPLSDAHRRRFSEVRAGKPQERTPARVAVLLARNQSERQKAIVRESRKTQTPPMLGRKHTPETRALMSRVRMGWKPSPDALASMSAGQRRRRKREQSCAS